MKNRRKAREQIEARAVRANRGEQLCHVAQGFAKILCELGPCYAVTVALTVPGEDESTVETSSYSAWAHREAGSSHLAEASDLLNKKHLEVQAVIDKAALKGEADGEGTIRETGSDAAQGGGSGGATEDPDEQDPDQAGGGGKPS